MTNAFTIYRCKRRNISTNFQHEDLLHVIEMHDRSLRVIPLPINTHVSIKLSQSTCDQSWWVPMAYSPCPESFTWIGFVDTEILIEEFLMCNALLYISRIDPYQVQLIAIHRPMRSIIGPLEVLIFMLIWFGIIWNKFHIGTDPWACFMQSFCYFGSATSHYCNIWSRWLLYILPCSIIFVIHNWHIDIVCWQCSLTLTLHSLHSDL